MKAELRAGPTVSVGSANREGFPDSTRSTGLVIFFPFINTSAGFDNPVSDGVAPS